VSIITSEHRAEQSNWGAARGAIEATMRSRGVPGMSVAVVGSDGPLFCDAFGFADLAQGRPSTTTTRYSWFSMSKVATATAVLRLADAGLLDLDAPFSEYLGQPRSFGTSQGTVRQLLSHTAGLANPLPIRWVHPPQSADRDDALLDELLERHVTPKYEVGGPARYSNVGYLILGRVIASASGGTFKEYLRTAVLHPAGMQGTDFGYTSPETTATGYVKAPRIATAAVKALLPHGVVDSRHGHHLALQPFLVDGAAYGGLVGDIADAARFVRLHLRDGELDGVRVLSPESAREMRRIVYPGPRFDHGLAWFRKPGWDARRPFHVEHYGTGAGYWNAMRLYPDLGVGMVVMANTTAPYDVDSLFETLLDHVVPS
jgi:CubicO group peptidase (beta-lactamase class C family)